MFDGASNQGRDCSDGGSNSRFDQVVRLARSCDRAATEYENGWLESVGGETQRAARFTMFQVNESGQATGSNSVIAANGFSHRRSRKHATHTSHHDHVHQFV